MQRISWMALALASLGAQATQAAPLVLTCPATLAVAESAQAPAGWEAVAAGQPHPFSNISLFSGHPREMASLAPDKQSRGAKQLLSIWSLPGGSERYWLACGYAQTTVQVAKQLPAGLSRCIATHTGPASALQASPEVRCE
jgi:hypothetical protein